MRGFDLWLQQSKLVPVDGRLQGVVLPLAICSAVELAGSTKQWLDWHLSEMCRKDFCIGWAIGPIGQNLTGIKKWNDSPN